MPDLTASIPHQLSRAEVKRRIQEQTVAVRQQYGAMLANLQESWTGDTMQFSLSAMGQPISGRLTVDDQAVHVTVALPWLLRMLAETIKPRIEQQGRLLLARPKQEATAGR
jgi:hypothetical protein